MAPRPRDTPQHSDSAGRTPSSAPAALQVTAWPPAAPVLCALVLRLLVPVVALAIAPAGPLFYEPDSATYLENAQSLCASGGFSRGGLPEIIRTPGYAVLLVPGVALGWVTPWVILSQAVAGALCVALAARVAVAWGLSATVVRRGAWLLAIEPISVLYCGKVLSDVWFTTALLAALWQLQRTAARSSARGVALAALLTAAAAFLRPIAYFLPWPWAIWVGWSARRGGHTWRGSVGRAALFLVVSLVPLVAWQGRNLRVADYGGFAGVSDLDLYFLHAAAVDARVAGREIQLVDQMDFEAYFRQRPHERDWSQGRVLASMGRAARATIAEHPGVWLRLLVTGMGATLCDNGTQAVLDFVGRAPVAQADERAIARSQPWRRLARACRTKPTMVATWLALEGVVVLWLASAAIGLMVVPWRRPTAVCVLLTVGYLLVLSGGPVGRHRFRLPIEPAICTLAAAGWCRLRGDTVSESVG